MNSFFHFYNLCHHETFSRCKSDSFRKSIFLCRSLYKQLLERDTQFFDPFLPSYFPRHLSRPFRSPLEHLCQLPYSFVTYVQYNEKCIVRSRSSSESVVQQTLRYNFLSASIFSSCLIVSNVFPNFFMSLMNDFMMTSNLSVSFTRSSDRIFSWSRIMTRRSSDHFINHLKNEYWVSRVDIRIIELPSALLDWYPMIFKSKIKK